MKILKQAVVLGCTAACSLSIFAYEPESKQITTSGNLSVVSKYVSRGLTNAPEDDDLAIQAGLNVAYGNFYVGYWGSTLGYSYAEAQGRKEHSSDKFEHDFLLGYTHSSQNYDFDLWNATYYYPGGKNTTGNELGLNVSRALNEKTTVSGSVSTYLYDVAYANQGDTFYTLNVSHQLNERLTANATAAGSYFRDEGKYEGGELGDTEKNHAFRYASAGLSYVLLPKLSLSGEYIFGGYDRYADKQRDLAVFGLSYDF
ncbi:hypothetical protein BS636_12870 [Acinetobacter sp. LoGeW2-3]|uniref:hypothetical protein n=1 Tax=Acinetobacter sp. LoGeW2-3 TaxID=1808001 RepID=UPI000C05BEFF|nr:hypothetical protein [Acinetobacter sp. LoGeW2-3]ATO20498.1 hypothetical protein BS636_12870 [Acinetobacter sp. LoGeW2-3]